MTMAQQFLVPTCFSRDDWMDSAIEDMRRISSAERIRFPLSNVLSNKKSGDLVIEMALAGYSPEDVSINTEDSKIVVEGKAQNHDEDFDVWRQDIKQSYFKQTFSISEKFDLSKLEAEFKNGILKVKIPVNEEKKPKTIKIKY